MADSSDPAAQPPPQPAQPEEEPLPEEILNASAEDIIARTRLIDNDLKVSSPLPWSREAMSSIASLALRDPAAASLPRAWSSQTQGTSADKN